MNPLFAQARFPAPEFEHYTLPGMNLETVVDDSATLRAAVLLLFLVVSGIAFYRLRSRQALLGISVAGLVVFGYVFTACPCPVGMYQNVAESVLGGTPAATGPLLLFVIPLAAALFFGRLFCAGVCPLGAVQELLHWKTLRVSRPLDRLLRMIPVALFLITTVAVASGMGAVLCSYDPYLPLFLLSFPLPLAGITIAFVLLGLVVSRPFCRYVCPYGVLLRFFAIFSALKPRITTEKCVSCKLCEQGCPNGAIVPPEEAPSPEIQRLGARRLSTLVAITPFALLLGGILGYSAAPIVAENHPDVVLKRMLIAREESFEVEAFESSGTSLASLEKDVIDARNTILLGMSFGGVVFAGCVMLELVSEARRRKEQRDYRIDGSLCFCCGRCFESCPPEKRRDSAQGK